MMDTIRIAKISRQEILLIFSSIFFTIAYLQLKQVQGTKQIILWRPPRDMRLWSVGTAILRETHGRL